MHKLLAFLSLNFFSLNRAHRGETHWFLYRKENLSVENSLAKPQVEFNLTPNKQSSLEAEFSQNLSQSHRVRFFRVDWPQQCQDG